MQTNTPHVLLHRFLYYLIVLSGYIYAKEFSNLRLLDSIFCYCCSKYQIHSQRFTLQSGYCYIYEFVIKLNKNKRSSFAGKHCHIDDERDGE